MYYHRKYVFYAAVTVGMLSLLVGQFVDEVVVREIVGAGDITTSLLELITGTFFVFIISLLIYWLLKHWNSLKRHFGISTKKISEKDTPTKDTSTKDISENKEFEERLNYTHSLFMSFFENSSDAFTIQDMDGRIQQVNSGFEETYGWKREEVRGKSIECTVPDDLLEDFRQQLRSVVLGGQAIPSFDTVRKKKDGTLIDVNVSGSPIFDDEGHQIGFAGVSRDYSTQKKLVRKLEEITSRLESVIKYSGDAISLVDRQGHITSVNPAWEELFGWNESEVKGCPSPVVQRGDIFSDVISGAVYVSVEAVKRTRDNRELPVSITVSPIYSSSQRVVGATYIYRDMTDKKRVEAMVLRSEKLSMAGELAAGIAHEIRNPLTSIQGFLQLMETSYKPSYLPILLSEVHSINSITNELLLLAKPQVDTFESENLISIIDEVLTLMRTQANLYSIIIHQNVEKRLPGVECVRDHMKQVFINLIKNSIEALPNGGNIHVSASQSAETVHLSVSDDGAGIPQEKLPYLGQPFYTTKERGAGLGLMVTYRIIQNHGGYISATSEVGRGTEFDITLPIKKSW